VIHSVPLTNNAPARCFGGSRRHLDEASTNC
jgi:hypothetical protein